MAGELTPLEVGKIRVEGALERLAKEKKITFAQKYKIFEGLERDYPKADDGLDPNSPLRLMYSSLGYYARAEGSDARRRARAQVRRVTFLEEVLEDQFVKVCGLSGDEAEDMKDLCMSYIFVA